MTEPSYDFYLFKLQCLYEDLEPIEEEEEEPDWLTDPNNVMSRHHY